MTAGLHTFPFSYNLPHNIPSSFEHRIGNVRYSIKAILHHPWKLDHKISKQLTINTPFDLDLTNLHRNAGIDTESYEYFHLFCSPYFKQGQMLLLFHLPSNCFTCNDVIEATKLEFHSKSPPKIKKVDCNIKSTEKSGPFPKEDDVKIGLRIPPLPLHSSTTKRFDIVIGSRSPLSRPTPNYLAPSAPSIMQIENSGEFNLESSIPSDNLTYPTAISHGTSDFPYSHQQSSRNIGFVYPLPTSAVENSNERK
ncbi:hypothetical protein PV325_008615 [Microctonus aethiopoides]|nr:hypothetical protein PV325_008615 [Microctonus aethiopoides]